MNRRPIYLLLLLMLMLFAKSYVSAVPANGLPVHCVTSATISHHSSVSDAATGMAVIHNASILDNDNEEEDDYASEWKKEATCYYTFSPADLYAKGFLVHSFKNAFPAGHFHSSYPPTYLRLRVIRI